MKQTSIITKAMTQAQEDAAKCQQAQQWALASIGFVKPCTNQMVWNRV